MSEFFVIFAVDGTPVAQPRHRMGKVQKGRRAGNAVAYLPKGHPVHAWKDLVRLAARRAYRNRPPLNGLVRIDAVYVFPRPADRPPGGRLPYDVKPDRDNLDKALLDALTGIVLGDDAIVWAGEILKVYGASGEEPGAAVRIRETPNNVGPGWWDEVL